MAELIQSGQEVETGRDGPGVYDYTFEAEGGDDVWFQCRDTNPSEDPFGLKIELIEGSEGSSNDLDWEYGVYEFSNSLMNLRTTLPQTGTYQVSVVRPDSWTEWTGGNYWLFFKSLVNLGRAEFVSVNIPSSPPEE